MRMCTLFMALVACMCLMTQGHAQAGLAGSLGFDVPCEGAVKPSCNTPLAEVNTGMCFIYVCNDGAAVDTDGNLCPVYSECLANEVREVTTDPNGCPRITCTANTGCVKIDMMRCPSGQHAEESGNLDDMQCPIFSCVSDTPPDSCTKRNADGSCADDEHVGWCPNTQMNCPPGYTQSLIGKDANGCSKFECKQKVCPEIATCPAGFTAKITTGTDGCNKLECVKNEVKECPVQAACKPGYTKVDLPVDSDGCKSFTCKKTEDVCPEQMACPTGSKRVEGKPGKDGCPTFTCEKPDTPTTPESSVASGECRAQSNSAGCSGTVSCPSGQIVTKAKVACNLEHGTVSDDQFDAVSMGKMKVVRASDNPAAGACQAGSTTLQSGEQSINVASAFSSKLKFSCKEQDKNGGDCHIRVAVKCASTTTNRWVIKSTKENISGRIGGFFRGQIDESKLNEEQKKQLGIEGLSKCNYKDITSTLGQICPDADAACFKFEATGYKRGSNHSESGDYTIYKMAKFKCEPSSGKRWTIQSTKENVIGSAGLFSRIDETKLSEDQKQRFGISGMDKCPYKSIPTTLGQECSGSQAACFKFDQTGYREAKTHSGVGGTAIYTLAKFSCK